MLNLLSAKTIGLTSALLLSSLCACNRGASEPVVNGQHFATIDTDLSKRIPLSNHILVDQFGYLPPADKVAVIRDPKVGYDQDDHFEPGAAYEVRAADTGSVVFSGRPKEWNNGRTQASSGDRGWWFDFSKLTTPGHYFVFDREKNLRSPVFAIGADVYRPVLKAALKTYFYQRSGFAKRPPFAAACWADDAAYLGKRQDTQARDVTDRDNDAKVRDLSGGWFDAGDTNKYVTFAVQPVHQLLTAYTENPRAFTDDFAIPESGNGIPDVIDEVKWEVEWLKKMQYSDGSLALKVGTIENGSASPPSRDSTPRYYIPACTSATIAGAGMFAHAAYVFAGFEPLHDEAAQLRSRAELAWRDYQRTPNKQTDCDNGTVRSGDADLTVEDQNGVALEAAVYLFSVTRDSTFERYIREHYREARPYRDMSWSRYNPDQGDALLFYTTLPFADRKLVETIRNDKLNVMRAGNQVYGFSADDDLYRAFLHDPQYHWGSNNPRANYGNDNLDIEHYSLDVAKPERYRTRALEILHYFHGVNPFAMVYLSNMYPYGATRSANEIFHTWFQPDTKWSNALTSECGPPPGYVPGGPNAQAAANGVPTTLKPPTGQPPQKSYRDWNANWPESSWAITEPGIYYQSAYVKLISSFVGSQ